MADLSRENSKALVFAAWKNGLKVKQIRSSLANAFVDRIPSQRSIYQWIKEFKAGKITFQDAPRSGRPAKAASEPNIAFLEQVIKENPRITVRQLQAKCTLSYGTVRRIIRTRLHLKKLSARWVPHRLTEIQKKERVRIALKNLLDFGPNGTKRLTDIVTGDESWICFYGRPTKAQNKTWRKKTDTRPTVLKPGFGQPKAFFTVFFTVSGPVLVDMLQRRQTMTGKYYGGRIIPAVLAGLKEQKPGRNLNRWSMLHDNASSHKTAFVRQQIIDGGLSTLEHPPYSPDLAPCDFFLFPKLKSLLSGRNFKTRPALAKAVNEQLRALPQSDYRHCFDSWLRRLKLCVDVGGEYFEGL